MNMRVRLQIRVKRSGTTTKNAGLIDFIHCRFNQKERESDVLCDEMVVRDNFEFEMFFEVVEDSTVRDRLTCGVFERSQPRGLFGEPAPSTT